MTGKCSWLCAPQPIARLIQLFPKLAIIFFLIHLTVIIYSLLNPSPHAKSKDTPPGVVDAKMTNLNVEGAHRSHTLNNKLPSYKNDTGLRKTKKDSLILKGLSGDNHHDNNVIEDSNGRAGIRRNHPGR